ncbi:serine/threonine protein kinase [Alicyclobacillus mengziensis]|uniref:Protein kinase n=1 Tax=Alicyclobacillus mengziensis TaxID=2931921 RepID=A0A9X7W1B1_9BACL|nr:protein kinase [Alicyclobacillus mengziensis]QSO48479.1 protein kinase [Alicyclobacillus mengziensis]
MVVRTDGHLIYLRNKLDEFDEKYQYFEQNARMYLDFYDYVDDESLRQFFSIFHYQLNFLFKHMNQRLQSGHYTANESRELLYVLDEISTVQANFRGTKHEFTIVLYYEDIIRQCEAFLQHSGGSPIPSGFPRIDLIETEPIFQVTSSIGIERGNRRTLIPTKMIGGGSYATVHKYKDDYYNRPFAIKRANKGLTKDEYQRFKTEFDTMQKLNSPYVVEVYSFNEENREYVMEYVDKTLDAYIAENNNKLDVSERISLVRQILKAFNYIHSKGVLHRDISTKNVLIKLYDELKVAKVADFGLVKLPGSTLTKSDTEMKGSLNDPKLSVTGFTHYDMRHETYALVRLIYFVMTGRLTVGKYQSKEFQSFIEKGLSDNLDDRYQDVMELQAAFNEVVRTL